MPQPPLVRQQIIKPVRSANYCGHPGSHAAGYHLLRGLLRLVRPIVQHIQIPRASEVRHRIPHPQLVLLAVRLKRDYLNRG